MKNIKRFFERVQLFGHRTYFYLIYILASVSFTKMYFHDFGHAAALSRRRFILVTLSKKLEAPVLCMFVHMQDRNSVQSAVSRSTVLQQRRPTRSQRERGEKVEEGETNVG